jgi:hypothetical protein
VFGDQPLQIVHETLSQKHPTQKRASRVAQGVERLPSKYENLNSNPSTTKKKSQVEYSITTVLLKIMCHHLEINR